MTTSPTTSASGPAGPEPTAVEPTVAAGPRAEVRRTIFVATVFLGSFLLFQVQPMVARLALPELGGAPAVWNSAMVVYQVLLLAGYGWAHWLRRFPVRRQVACHLGLLVVACFWLPIGLASFTPPTGNSVVLFVPMLLLVSVGPVILAVSAQAPLMQQWFAAGSDRNPYPLYSASNLGSFAGLLAYPFVVEPLLRLDTQRWGWSACYGVLIVLVAGCGVAAVRAVRVGGSRTEARQVVRGVVPRRRIGLWIVLSAVPSGLMLSTTTHLSTDIMAMPLLWAIPLGLYLLSFSVAFAERRAASRFITKVGARRPAARRGHVAHRQRDHRPARRRGIGADALRGGGGGALTSLRLPPRHREPDAVLPQRPPSAAPSAARCAAWSRRSRSTGSTSTRS